jgi:hypothetical protein
MELEQSYNDEGVLVAMAAQREWWFAEESTIDCGAGKESEGDWPDGQRTFFVEMSWEELHIQK